MTTAAPADPTTPAADVLQPGHFAYRHIGPRREDVADMLQVLGYDSLDHFIDAVVPEEIRLRRPLALPPGRSEREVLQALRGLAGMNRVFRSYIGMGYAGCFTPQVVQRNVLENPGWYTAYTPYQAEISQGRLEALLNFQTMVSDLTGLRGGQRLAARRGDGRGGGHEPLARGERGEGQAGLPGGRILPPADDRRRAHAGRGARDRGGRGEPETFTFEPGVFGALVQYPATDGAVRDFRRWRAGARRRRPGDRGDRPAEPDAARAAGRMGRRHRRRQQPALRGADGLRRTARRLLRHARRVQALPAGPHHRRLQRPGRDARRSAWRCRPGSSTSAGRRRRATCARRRCCWRSWPACTRCIMGPAASGGSPSGSTTARWCWPTRSAACATGSPTTLLRYGLRRGAGVGAAPAARCRPRPDDQPAAALPPTRSASRWTRP